MLTRGRRPQALVLGAIVELDTDALSWGAAALEKAFFHALVNLFAGGTAPSAFLDAYAPYANVACLLQPSGLRRTAVCVLGSAVALWPEALVLI